MFRTSIPALVIIAAGSLGVSAAAGVIVFVDPTIGETYQEAQENAFLAATSGLTMIDFDDVPPGSVVIGNEWASLGITFSQPGGYQLEALEQWAAFTARSAPNGLFAKGGTGISEDIRLDLATPQYAVGMWIMDNELTSPGYDETLSFYGAANNLITSVPLPRTGYATGTTDSNFFIGVISDEPIAWVLQDESEFEDPTETAGWDNVYFGVPEPASLALMLLAAALPSRRR